MTPWGRRDHAQVTRKSRARREFCSVSITHNKNKDKSFYKTRPNSVFGLRSSVLGLRPSLWPTPSVIKLEKRLLLYSFVLQLPQTLPSKLFVVKPIYPKSFCCTIGYSVEVPSSVATGLRCACNRRTSLRPSTSRVGLASGSTRSGACPQRSCTLARLVLGHSPELSIFSATFGLVSTSTPSRMLIQQPPRQDVMLCPPCYFAV